jgi:hypothetical protein
MGRNCRPCSPNRRANADLFRVRFAARRRTAFQRRHSKCRPLSLEPSVGFQPLALVADVRRCHLAAVIRLMP